MAAIKMQPLVIDMGGVNERKFASEADFQKVAAARQIKIRNSGSSKLDVVYSAVASLANTVDDLFIRAGADEVHHFANKQSYADTTGDFLGSNAVSIYKKDGVYMIEVYEY